MRTEVHPETIRRALDVPRLTMGDLADRTGASQAALNKYRQGERRMPQDVRLHLAHVLDAHAAELRALAEALRED
jgi:transcriptional regulator with XRE-family HTH domain